VGAVLSPDQAWVELRRVSPVFAAEVQQGLARADQPPAPVSYAPAVSYGPPTILPGG
jgi:hypothetical protein